MPIEIERNEKQLEHIVYQLSPVAESLLLGAAIAKNDVPGNPHAKNVYEALIEHPVIAKLKSFGEDGLLSLASMILPVAEFTSIERFVEKLRILPHDEFMYEVWSGWVDFPVVQALLKDPSLTFTFEDNLYMHTDEARQQIYDLLQDVQSFKEELADYIYQIGSHESFQQFFESKKPELLQALSEVEALELEPLQRAQFVMGKTFRRVSPYKMYYYIPTAVFDTLRIRIFNENVCIIMFAATTPLVDKRERVAQLAKQLKVIADPTRLQLLSMISVQKEYGARLAEFLGITTATVSHHIEMLKKAGLIKEEKIGAIKYFSTDKEQLEKLTKELKIITHLK